MRKKYWILLVLGIFLISIGLLAMSHQEDTPNYDVSRYTAKQVNNMVKSRLPDLPSRLDSFPYYWQYLCSYIGSGIWEIQLIINWQLEGCPVDDFYAQFYLNEQTGEFQATP